LPFQAVASQRLYERVADQVADLIGRGEFAPGDRLPPERDLARVLGVSRPTVREAMIALEITGVVEVRVGAGIFVAERLTDRTLTQRASAGASPSELVSARRMIEPEVAARAAAAATARDLAGIAETLGLTEAATDSAAHRAADRQFHVRIALATGNAVLTSIVEDFWGEMFSPMFERLGTRTGLIAARCTPQRLDQTLAEHQDIFRAIERHDMDEARSAMDRHLAAVESILARGSATPATTTIEMRQEPHGTEPGNGNGPRTAGRRPPNSSAAREEAG
jgi:DNA-binding FadR family transcriptional regulator